MEELGRERKKKEGKRVYVVRHMPSPTLLLTRLYIDYIHIFFVKSHPLICQGTPVPVTYFPREFVCTVILTVHRCYILSIFFQK